MLYKNTDEGYLQNIHSISYPRRFCRSGYIARPHGRVRVLSIHGFPWVSCIATRSTPQNGGCCPPHTTKIRLDIQNCKYKLFTKQHARGSHLGTCTSLCGSPYPVGSSSISCTATRPCPEMGF